MFFAAVTAKRKRAAGISFNGNAYLVKTARGRRFLFAARVSRCAHTRRVAIMAKMFAAMMAAIEYAGSAGN
jgi:hypothetical protein